MPRPGTALGLYKMEESLGHNGAVLSYSSAMFHWTPLKVSDL